MEIKEKGINHLLEIGLKREISEDNPVLEVIGISSLIKDNVWANWSVFICRTLVVLSEKIKSRNESLPQSFCSLGIGPGVGTIGALYAFENLNRIILTDIDERIVKIAKNNLLMRKDISKVEIIELSGDLCKPLREAEYKVDVICENMPNVPNDDLVFSNYNFSSDNELINKNKLATTDLFNLELLAKKYLLESHLVSLIECYDCLNNGGSLILSMGGRVPLDVFSKIIEGVGYKYEELVAGFKLQNAPEKVIVGYADIESKKDSFDFDFYLYDKAIELLEENGIMRDDPIIKDGDGEKLKEILEPAKINARKAKELYDADPNIKIGHTVHMLRAKKRG